MVLNRLLGFIYPLPPSIYISAMSIITLASQTNAGLMEFRGKNMPYSKFWNVAASAAGIEKKTEKAAAVPAQISSRIGMVIIYTPAFIAGAAALVFLPDVNLRFGLVRWALTIHFCKRILEALFVHKFSSAMDVGTSMVIALSYFLSTATLIYTQHLSNGFPEPPTDLTPLGISLFLIGISGNFYHHFLLSKLRSNGKKEYVLPKGGLFSLVICPHYLFEIIDFFGIAFISQTLYGFSVAFGTMMYLTGRSIATRKWYESKFDVFPTKVKAVFPFLL